MLNSPVPGTLFHTYGCRPHRPFQLYEPVPTAFLALYGPHSPRTYWVPPGPACGGQLCLGEDLEPVCAQIRDATVQVFREGGYAAFDAGPGQMVFQKEGTKMNNIGQNGVVGSYYGAQTIIRVRAQIVDLGTGTFRLQCQAYMVRNAGDSFFEDEHPLVNARRGPYQRLLNKVAKRLKAA